MVCLDTSCHSNIWMLVLTYSPWIINALVMVSKQQYQPMETSQGFEMTDLSRGEWEDWDSLNPWQALNWHYRRIGEDLYSQELGAFQASQLLEKPQTSGSQSETTPPSETALPPDLRQGHWVSNSFQATPATVSTTTLLHSNGSGMSTDIELTFHSLEFPTCALHWACELTWMSWSL